MALPGWLLDFSMIEHASDWREFSGVRDVTCLSKITPGRVGK
jgi:hypothetical protein